MDVICVVDVLEEAIVGGVVSWVLMRKCLQRKGLGRVVEALTPWEKRWLGLSEME